MHSNNSLKMALCITKKMALFTFADCSHIRLCCTLALFHLCSFWEPFFPFIMAPKCKSDSSAGMQCFEEEESHLHYSEYHCISVGKGHRYLCKVREFQFTTKRPLNSHTFAITLKLSCSRV